MLKALKYLNLGKFIFCHKCNLSRFLLKPRLSSCSLSHKFSLPVGNEITTLPTEIGLLANLESLEFCEWICFQSNNIFVSTVARLGLTLRYLLRRDESKMMIYFYRWTELISCFLYCVDSNKITSIPSEIGFLTNLNSLDFYSNEIKALPSEIGLLTNLKSLHFFNNEIKALPSEIGSMTALTSLLFGEWFWCAALSQSIYGRDALYFVF